MKLTKGKGCLLALIAAPLLMWGAYKLAYPSYSWHQKITIVLETPDGEVSGSAVQSVTWSKQPKILPDARATSSSPNRLRRPAEAPLLQAANDNGFIQEWAA